MSSSTQSKERPEGLFDIGSILGRVADVGISTFEEIAPIWARQELNLGGDGNRQDRRTFQETIDQRLRQLGLTNAEGRQSRQGSGGDSSPQNAVVLSMNQILLISGGVLLTLVMLQE